MNPMSHDPRVNPIAGDRVAKDGKERQVEDVWYEAGKPRRLRVSFLGTGVTLPDESIRSWRRWAKDGEVTYAAA